MNKTSEKKVIARYQKKILTKEVLTLKRMRLSRKITRNDAAKAVGISYETISRFEQGRADFPEERIKALIRRYRYTIKEYNDILLGKVKLPDLHVKSIHKKSRKTEQEKRKYQKLITKEVRVIKSIRLMKGISKAQAGKLCNLHPSVIDHLENGRTELKKERIEHILKSYNITKSDFEYMCSQRVLRPEIIHECKEIIKQLDNDKLQAVQALLQNFR